MQNKRSKWKNQFQQIDSASKFHEKIRSIFQEDPFFRNLSCFQEVPVSALVNSYTSNRHCVDWYIDELGMILELHGEQHYAMANYGNIPYEEAVKQFNNIKYRDNEKKLALTQAGYEYREISYKLKNKITAALLKEILLNEEK